MWNFAGDLLEFFPKLELPKQLTEATRKGSDMVVSQFLRLKANTFVEGHYVAYHSHFPSGFCSSSAGKESTCNAGDPTSIPRSGSSPGKGIGYRSIILGFFGGSDDKESACNVGDLGSVPELGRYPGEGNYYPLQYSGLENSMDRGA